MSTIAPGVCRHCGCSESSPCRAHREDCCWTDSTRTVCATFDCIKRERDRKRAARAQADAKPRSLYAELRSRGWGHGAAADEVRKRNRKKGRAA